MALKNQLFLVQLDFTWAFANYCFTWIVQFVSIMEVFRVKSKFGVRQYSKF